MPHHPDSAPAFALFDDNLDASTAGAWLLTGLVEEIRCTDPDAWPAALARLERPPRMAPGSPSPPATNSATPSNPACAPAAGRR
jgi:hypothetical protein